MCEEHISFQGIDVYGWMSVCVCVCGCGCISGSKCVSDGLGICMLEFVLVSVGGMTSRSGRWDFPSS